MPLKRQTSYNNEYTKLNLNEELDYPILEYRQTRNGNVEEGGCKVYINGKVRT